MAALTVACPRPRTADSSFIGSITHIALGATDTDALEEVRAAKVEQQMVAHTPMGRPQDMANAAATLCSTAASWNNGQILTGCGGAQDLD